MNFEIYISFVGMSKKKLNKNNKVILFLKNDCIKRTALSNQTANMRNSINERIRNLGNKYYNMKNLLEKLNLKRDFLFLLGKRLVEEYKDIKIGINLQTQQRRMKEGLIAWFAEFFYDDIFNPDSEFINKYLIQNASKKSSNAVKTSNLQKENANVSQTKSIFQDIVFNKEIDSFEQSNTENDLSTHYSSSKSTNFDFNSLFELTK